MGSLEALRRVLVKILRLPESRFRICNPGLVADGPWDFGTPLFDLEGFLPSGARDQFDSSVDFSSFFPASLVP